MNKLIFALVFLAFMACVPASLAYTQDLYYNDNTTASDFNITSHINVSSSAAVCNTTLQAFADVINYDGGLKNYQFTLYNAGSPLGTIVYNSNQNATCLALPSSVVASGDLVPSIRSQSFSANAFVRLYLEAHSNCGLIDNATINITDSHDSSNNFAYNSYMTLTNNAGTGNISGLVNAQWQAAPSHCVPSNKFSPANTNIGGSQGAVYFLPFNSGLGTVNLEYKEFPIALDSWAFGYMKLSTGQVTTLLINDTIYFYNQTVSLQPFTDYVSWVIMTKTFGLTGYSPAMMNVSFVDFVPDYSCSFGTCVAGSKLYTCIDLKGVAPTTVASVSCLNVNQTIDMGFEDSTPVLEQACVKSTYPLCFDAINNISAGLPYNPPWQVFPFDISGSGLNYYFATMVNGGSKGSFSFKMWSIPPSPPVQPTLINTTVITCGNASVGSIPDTFINNISATFFTAHNFTFPSDTMHILVDTKACAAPVVQYDGWCGKSCFSYLGNCSIKPKNDYFISVYDNTALQSILVYSAQASDNWTTKDIDISNHLTNPTHSYTLILGVGDYPQDQYSPYSWCVQFDNVRLFNAENSTLEDLCVQLYGLPCSSLTPAQLSNVNAHFCQADVCVGNDRHLSSIQGGICVSDILLNDSSCFAANPANKITGSQSIFTPISSIADAPVGNSTLAENAKAGGWGFSLVFLTPVFLIMMFIVVVMVVASYLTKHMEIGVASGILVLGALSMAIPELFVITVILVAITAFIVGRSVVKAVAGGGS